MKARIVFAILVILFLPACNGTFDVGIEHPGSSTATLPPAATENAAPSNTPAATLTQPPAATTLAPSNTALPTLTLPAATSTLSLPTATVGLVPSNTAMPAGANPLLGNYIDDRSSPWQVLVSYYNAINRHEYLRAYEYWSDPANSAGSFSDFANGYQNTASVDLVFGHITGGAGAGQLYFTVPVLLKTVNRDGTHANFAACYVIHQAQPANFGAPPFIPMGIDRGKAKVADLHANDTDALASACDGYPSGSPVIITAGGMNIDRGNYLDIRSGPIETVSSLLNAINRQEYVRAYSYFQDPASFPGDFAAYAAGYSDTVELMATFGTVQSEGAAGNLYFKVPLALNVLTSSGGTRTFVGCYTLHLGQPANQATPPFRPLGILSGKFSQVNNGTDVNSMLPTACQ